MLFKIRYIIPFFLICFSILSCSDDDSIAEDPFVVAFEFSSINLLQMEDEDTVGLVYSKSSTSYGEVGISYTSSDLVYGVDFITIPEAINNELRLPINSSNLSNSFTFKRLSNNFDENTEIEFIITDLDILYSSVQGNTVVVLNSNASLGGSLEPEIGGPNEGNQVFIDLSSDTATSIQRDSWDLGFYGGDNFRVGLNSSIYMAAAQLNFTDIDGVTQNDVSSLQSQVAVGTFNPDNEAYIDAPNGNILETAIAEVSEIDNENKVYLVNLGYAIGTTTPTTGSVAIAGDHRGWKKIRILKSGEDYLLQYADIDATTHQEVTISKDSNYNFSFFSFNTNTTVSVEPEKDKWDISFTVFTNVIEGAGSYGYSDFVTHNRKGSVTAYMVETATSSYEAYALSNVDYALLTENQTVIGGNWRDVFSGAPFSDRFFVLEDPNGNLYKLKFLALTNNNGERGYPNFEYELL